MSNIITVVSENVSLVSLHRVHGTVEFNGQPVDFSYNLEARRAFLEGYRRVPNSSRKVAYRINRETPRFRAIEKYLTDHFATRWETPFKVSRAFVEQQKARELQQSQDHSRRYLTEAGVSQDRITERLAGLVREYEAHYADAMLALADRDVAAEQAAAPAEPVQLSWSEYQKVSGMSSHTLNVLARLADDYRQALTNAWDAEKALGDDVNAAVYRDIAQAYAHAFHVTSGKTADVVWLPADLGVAYTLAQ